MIKNYAIFLLIYLFSVSGCSLGIVKNGVSRSFIKEVREMIPNAGFHKTLMRFTLIQLGRNPLTPFPMMRIKNLYKN